MHLRIPLHSYKSHPFSFQSIPHSLRKTPGGGGHVCHSTVHGSRATEHELPIFRTLFQVPYPASPLFATLTQTAGGGGFSSHCGSSPAQSRETRLAPCFRVILATGPTSVLRIQRSCVRRFLLFSGAFRLSTVDCQRLLPWLFTGHGARGTFSEGLGTEAQTRGNETCVAPAAQQAESRTGANDWRCSGDGPCTRKASR